VVKNTEIIEDKLCTLDGKEYPNKIVVEMYGETSCRIAYTSPPINKSHSEVVNTISNMLKLHIKKNGLLEDYSLLIDNDRLL
jgi:hypothetical protein